MTTTTKPMDDGGPAFPWGEHGTRLGGLSMRDYFAAKAMQALIIRNGAFHPDDALDAADALLGALRARQENSNDHS